jgi:hypothetical protein
MTKLPRNNNFLEFTINNENLTLNLNVLRNSCAKIAYFSSEMIFTFLYEGSNTQMQFSNLSCVFTYLS